MKKPKGKLGERSFTLIETVIALGLLVVVIMQVAFVQTNAVGLSSYTRRVTQATWLAKAIMTKIEYGFKFYEPKEMRSDPTFKEKDIDPELCPKEMMDCDYKYTVEIEDFPLPFIDIALGNMGAAGGEEGDASKQGAGGFADMIKQQIKEVMGGDEILKIAKVELSWPEGSKRNSMHLAYLLTAQQKLDPFIEMLDPPKDDAGAEGVPQPAVPGEPIPLGGGVPPGGVMPPGGQVLPLEDDGNG